MAMIELYKDNELIFKKNGMLKDKFYIFDNIKYDYINNILIREDDDFKYCLNFNEKEAIVTIKQNNFNLDLSLEIKSINLNKNLHEIIYKIESDESKENKIIVFL